MGWIGTRDGRGATGPTALCRDEEGDSCEGARDASRTSGEELIPPEYNFNLPPRTTGRTRRERPHGIQLRSEDAATGARDTEVRS